MPDSPRDRRRVYVKHLRGLEKALRSENRSAAAEARRSLAHLRYGLVEGKQHQASVVAFRRGQPQDSEEEKVWLLLGGLFALHPLDWANPPRPRSLGASLGRLQKKLDSPRVERRLSALLTMDRNSLPHHLRQTVRLLSSHDVPVHYDQLLDDLVVLLGGNHRGDLASEVRLRWAREYHMPISGVTPQDSSVLPETTE
ncbi:type I-E CRISPR-associated protein Cse2/CasB [Streptosporangium saharense]|uniref:CRISPR system Cascade subunit CasB n=1 Tax=Streptosporangium saharense TaxID=1706840 RepID=A0A7W7QSD4_9ACTN|nr:type I-E CRISPR-associated protein Cse2/CasB [Streptosporangium saharense]MBB4918920.1 CRISPR system Cascade subunit CasB [Streptosporangium saharense]